jgi:dUTP pyrophosphatase
MTVKVPVRFTRVDPRAIVPSYAHPGDAGADLYALEDTVIFPGETSAVRTGIAVEIPEGWEIQVRPRSGWALKRPEYLLPNSPGTIDSGYRDEVKVLVRNATTDKMLNIVHGDRIAQAVLSRVYEIVWEETIELAESERGLGGFGSTGR